MLNTKSLYESASTTTQGAPEWFMARLGYFTSSNIYKLMSDGRKAQFTETGMTYIYQVAAEKNLFNIYKIDPTKFAEYHERTRSYDSKAISWGKEKESIARRKYMRDHPDYEVCECGFIVCGYVNDLQIPNYGDSPDGVVFDKDMHAIGCIEIKCPTPETWMRYKAGFAAGKSLKDIKPEYYWQCMSHILVNDVQWCDFIYFDPMQRNGYQCVRTERNEKDIAYLKERVLLANEQVELLLA